VTGDPPEDEGLEPQERPGDTDDVPELDPEFREALREAAGKPPDSESGPDTAEYAVGEAPDQPPEAAEEEEPAEEEAADEEPPEEDEVAAAEAAEEAEPDEAEEDEAEEEPAEAAAEEPGEPVAADVEQTEVLADSARTEVRQAIAAAEQGGRDWAPPRPPRSGDPDPAPKPKRFWWRFSLASFLIVASMAAATAASLLLFLDDIAAKLRDSSIEGVKPFLANVDEGGPETFLILGSDKRASAPGDPGRSDTTLLLRLDPDQGRVALMSIPRDLKVDIPGYGVGKFNSAYTFGGPKLTLRVVKQLTGLQINHLVNVDFLGFVRAVYAIGCVWVDVDRHYYHSNAGLPPSLQYSEINVPAGYQRLCGKDALAYVRYRHTDTDLVRAARQQDFLREARARVPLSTFINDRGKLIDIFTTYTTSDINSAETMLEVLKLMFNSRNAAIKEVHFPAVLGPSYVYASRSAIRDAVDQFLGFQASGGPRGALDLPARGAKKGGKGKEKPAPAPQSDGLVNAASGSKLFARQVARKVGADFPVFYPRRLPSGTIYEQSPRVYHMRDTNEDKHGAYRFVLQLPQGDYFGVQGIRGWDDPPILDGQSIGKTMAGRDYDIFLDGDRVRLVAWHEGDNTYWVVNSLLQTLTNDQMLGIARSVGEIVPKRKPNRHRRRQR
jgi:polyisoprenyl-teichoic acid--peptidoglycan teichoic acid transferase